MMPMNSQQLQEKDQVVVGIGAGSGGGGGTRGQILMFGTQKPYLKKRRNSCGSSSWTSSTVLLYGSAFAAAAAALNVMSITTTTTFARSPWKAPVIVMTPFPTADAFSLVRPVTTFTSLRGVDEERQQMTLSAFSKSKIESEPATRGLVTKTSSSTSKEYEDDDDDDNNDNEDDTDNVNDTPSVSSTTDGDFSPTAAIIVVENIDAESLLQQDDDTTTHTGSSLLSPKSIIFGLLWITACLSALDRIAMSVALVPMAEEFMYTDTMKGSISSLLSVGYGLTILPAGLVVATVSPRLCIMAGIAIWSLATMATPVTASMVDNNSEAAAALLWPLLLARALVGAGESIVLPTTQRFLTAWALPEEKSRSLAFIYSGFAAGTVAAYLLSPVIMEHWNGWRDLFTIYGATGLLLLVPWLLLAQDSNENGNAQSIQQPVRPIATTAGSEAAKSPLNKAFGVLKEAPWKDLATSKGAWAMLLAHSAKNWGLYNSLAWTPTFYAEQYGIGVKDSAWLSLGPSIVGAIGGFVAGFAADKVVQDMKHPSDIQARTRIRNIFQSIGLLGPAVALGTLAWQLPEEAWMAQIFLSASFGLQAFNAGGYEAANQEKAGTKWAGLLYSVTSLPAVLAGTAGVYLTGQMLDATGQEWSLVFGINAAINVLGAAAFIALYDAKKEFD